VTKETEPTIRVFYTKILLKEYHKRQLYSNWETVTSTHERACARTRAHTHTHTHTHTEAHTRACYMYMYCDSGFKAFWL